MRQQAKVIHATGKTNLCITLFTEEKKKQKKKEYIIRHKKRRNHGLKKMRMIVTTGIVTTGETVIVIVGGMTGEMIGGTETVIKIDGEMEETRNGVIEIVRGEGKVLGEVVMNLGLKMNLGLLGMSIH